MITAIPPTNQQEGGMFKIGDFSRLSQVSIKALRYYDEIGLLPPAHIDPFTSYRYYSAEQLPRLNRILALKDLGLSLEQIAALLDQDLPPDRIQNLLRAKRAEIARQVAEEQARLAQVEARLRQIEQEGTLPAYDVVIKPVEPLLVLAARAVIPTYADIGPLFGAVVEHLEQHGINPGTCYPWLSLYHDEGFKEQDVDVTLAAPLSRTIPEGEPVTVETLPGTDTMLSVIHHGLYDTLGAAYTALMQSMQTNRLCVSGPNRTLYLHGPFQGGEPESFVTEIQFPVEQV
jgi:DNA-binding transcriptional MerR regulator